MLGSMSQSDARPLEMLILYRPLGLIRGRVRDINLHGALVDTGLVHLAKDSEVEVTMALSSPGKRDFHRFDAIVIEAAEQTARLLFTALPLQTRNALKAAVADRPAALHRTDISTNPPAM